MTIRDQAGATSVALPPGPEGLLEAGRESGDVPSPLTILMDLFHRYGDIVHYRTRFNSFYLINDPALVRDVLRNHNYVRNPLLRTLLGNGILSANGPHWERQRRLMLPAFQNKHVEQMVGLFARVAEQRIATWNDRRDPSESLNLSQEMDRIALSNIGQALFGYEIDDRFLGAIRLVMRNVAGVGNAAVFGLPLVRQTTANRDFQAALGVMENEVQAILAVDGRDGAGPSNLLQILRSARHGESDIPLTARELRDEVMTMIAAGHETTSVSVAWASYAIATHAHVAERFYDEVDAVIGQRPIVAEDLPRLSYTRKVVDETLRLYPAIWLIARSGLRDDELGGYRIPAMSGVLLSPFVLHRHPRYWPDPERFDPERFASGSDEQEAYSYFPFLAGRHLCLGKYFALTEAVVVLATIARYFRFEVRDEPVEFDPLISLRIRDDLHVQLIPRGRGATTCARSR